MADSANVKLYVYNGETYIGTFSTATKVENPVKVMFSYENTTTTSAKLTWLLSPVFPKVLLNANSPSIEYSADDIKMLTKQDGSHITGTDIIADLLNAYNSIAS